MVKKTKYEQDIENAAQELKRILGQPEEGIDFYTILNHVSRSGMFRRISLYIIKDNQPICLARESPCYGCGMDMGFELAYNVFGRAYGYTNDNYKYQDKLKHRWM